MSLIQAIHGTGRHGLPAVEALLETFDRGSEELRNRVVSAIRSIGPAAVPTLERYLRERPEAGSESVIRELVQELRPAELKYERELERLKLDWLQTYLCVAESIVNGKVRSLREIGRYDLGRKRALGLPEHTYTMTQHIRRVESATGAVTFEKRRGSPVTITTVGAEVLETVRVVVARRTGSPA